MQWYTSAGNNELKHDDKFSRTRITSNEHVEPLNSLLIS